MNPSRNGVGRRVSSVDELTPWESHGGRWYKRDDLFEPFDDLPLSGGKVRQAMLLLGRQEAAIRRDYGGVVLTATGVHSPQGLIIARVARSLGLRCVLFIGATSVGGALLRHAMLRRAIEVGAEIDASARVAYEPALATAIECWRDQHGGDGYVVRFGINLEDDPMAVLGSTAAQVGNVPSSVRRIVVPVGAGVTIAGVIMGAPPHVQVVGVGIAGYDRREAISRMAGRPGSGSLEWHVVEGVPYSRLVQRSVADGFALDPIYEAKAHDWLVEHERDDGSVAFWVVGDSTAVRSVTTAAAAAGGRRSGARRAPAAALSMRGGP